MHPAAPYWSRGIDAVPMMTGAASLMDCADIRQHAEALGFTLPLHNVLDVGCGTGRLAQVCEGYVGVDIAQSAVDYCQRAGLPSMRIDGPQSLDESFPFSIDWILCLSVFTHIDWAERNNYLEIFRCLSPRLLVDVIPGDGSGDVALWTADWPSFKQQLEDTGWTLKTFYDRIAPTGPRHRYVYAERV